VLGLLGYQPLDDLRALCLPGVVQVVQELGLKLLAHALFATGVAGLAGLKRRAERVRIAFWVHSLRLSV
jgi:hypothetical protein